jgi:prepilin-type N-terminal cleavage/methylation domain-containing protein
MRLTSIGTPGVLRPICRDLRSGQEGFTLIEALVAMAVLLAFMAVLGPHLFHARRIAENSQGRVAAQALLRAILDTPFDRSALASGGAREGDTDGLRWSITAEPTFIDAMVPADGPVPTTEPPKEAAPTTPGPPKESAVKRPRWAAFRLVATVSWGPQQMVSAETIRLGAAE